MLIGNRCAHLLHSVAQLDCSQVVLSNKLFDVVRADGKIHQFPAQLFNNIVVRREDGNRFGIAGMNFRAFLKEYANNFERGSEADIVRIGFESEAKDRDGLALMKEADFLDRAQAVGIIGKNVKSTLVECLNRRNGCGSNLLLHDGGQAGIGQDRAATVTATKVLLERSQEQQVRFVTVDVWDVDAQKN